PFPCRGYLRRLHGHGRLRPLPPTRICIGRCHTWHIGEYDIADVNVELTKNPTGRYCRNWHKASFTAQQHHGSCWGIRYPSSNSDLRRSSGMFSIDSNSSILSQLWMDAYSGEGSLSRRPSTWYRKRRGSRLC